MTTRWPSSCFGAVSSIQRSQNAVVRLAFLKQQQQHGALYQPLIIGRRYAANNGNHATLRPEKAAFISTTQQSKNLDTINPPSSTLPPPLKLPERGHQNVAMYYFRIGRAYGSFYWMGIKAVWFNHQAAKILRKRVKAEGSEDGKQDATTAVLRHLTRSEFQILHRNDYDIGKLPFFGLLVMMFGEWLPVLVPFIPGAVPGTCRIPKQIRGMREKAEERRRASFRQGIAEPTPDQLQPMASEDQGGQWSLARREYAASTLTSLRSDQLYHLSSTLNLHNRLWDRIQLPPPAFLLRRALAKRLAYLTGDDLLLTKYGGASKLITDELMIACEQRGIDVLGRQEETLRENLAWWLARQREDKGRGCAVFTMLFRRPNAWEASLSKAKGQSHGSGWQ